MYSKIKRVLDLLFAIILTILLSPLFIIISIIIKIDGGKILFKQKRIGKNNKEFLIYKFRTDDLKITKFGKILRFTNLDALPQLFNIIKGDMSLIGPRPILKEALKKNKNILTSISPGLIGYSTSCDQSNIDYEQIIELDLYYVTHISFLLDLKCLFNFFKKGLIKLYKSEYFSYIFFTLFFILSFIFQYLSRKAMIPYIYYSYFLYAFGFLSLIFYLIYKRKIGIDYFDILMMLLVMFGLISYNFAYNKEIALFGFIYRYEGILSLVSYYAIFCYGRTVIKKELLLKTLLTIGFIQVLYCFYQRTIGIIDVVGLVGHHNFVGTFMILFFALSFGLYLSKKVSIIYPIIYFIGILLSNTMSAFVGLLFVLIFSIFYFKKHVSIKKYIFCLLIFLCLFITYDYFNENRLFNRIKEVNSEFLSITVDHKIEESYGTNRVYIWKNAFKVIPKHWLTGVGVDNFLYSFNGRMLINRNRHEIVDKAHNEFLQIFVTEGVFAFITYVVFYLSIVYLGFKKKDYLSKTLFLGILAYLVQAQLNISVIEVAPYFYLVMGLFKE